MKQISSQLIGLSIIALAVYVVGSQAVQQYSDLKERELINEAGFQCAQISKYTTQDDGGATVSYPVEEIYEKCLKEKGIGK